MDEMPKDVRILFEGLQNMMIHILTLAPGGGMYFIDLARSNALKTLVESERVEADFSRKVG